MASKDDDDKRTCGMVAVAVPALKVTRPVFGRHGLAGGALVVDWAAIVGGAVAAHAMPLRIKFPPKERTDGTLVVKVASSAFATELQHLEPLILERINGYFGYRAVARLQLRHGPLPRRAAPRPPPPPPTGEAPATAALARIEDPDLREALERLGRRLAR